VCDGERAGASLCPCPEWPAQSSRTWVWSYGSAPHDGGGSLGDFFITAVESTTPVEVLGRYSNLCDQGERICALLEMSPEGPVGAKVRTPKQAQHRLSSVETDSLVADYRAGVTVLRLADRYQIHRDTVSEILDRNDIARRPRGIPPELLKEVIETDTLGSSLAAIGKRLSVDPTTVGNALRAAGVSLRPRRGWHK
jgi:hypothetical protein